MNSTLRSPSTTVDTERSERMEKGVNPSRKTHEGVVRLARRAAVTRFKHQVGSIPTAFTKNKMKIIEKNT